VGGGGRREELQKGDAMILKSLSEKGGKKSVGEARSDTIFLACVAVGGGTPSRGKARVLRERSNLAPRENRATQ